MRSRLPPAEYPAFVVAWQTKSLDEIVKEFRFTDRHEASRLANRLRGRGVSLRIMPPAAAFLTLDIERLKELAKQHLPEGAKYER